VRTGKSAESFKRHVHRWLASDRLFNYSQQRIKKLLIHVPEKLDREMNLGRLHPGDVPVSIHVRLNFTLQLLLDKGDFRSKLLGQFDGKKRPDHFKPALFMTVRREIARKFVPREAYLACDDSDTLALSCASRASAADRRLQQKCS
jgi:hypothetical protein